jgi:hypothetical protein
MRWLVCSPPTCRIINRFPVCNPSNLHRNTLFKNITIFLAIILFIHGSPSFESPSILEESADGLDYLILVLVDIILEDYGIIAHLKAFIKLCFLLAIMILREMILLRRTHIKVSILELISDTKRRRETFLVSLLLEIYNLTS